MPKKKEAITKEYRPPIVALLGHVDHGKTTILDKIRESAIQESEEGGITQGISVYSVRNDEKDITFIDTPGHEAFDLMRARGGSAADIVLLVVAANDGVKPQTKESIEIIKKAKKPCIVVLNKTDISGIDIPKVKRELSNEGIVVESMGGDVPSVEVSGKTGKGIPELLEMIQLVADVSQVSIKKPPVGVIGEAFVLESLKDKSRGNVSTIVVTAGEFEKGSYIGYWSRKEKEVVVEKIKGFLDDRGGSPEFLKQGYGGEIIGLGDIVELGDIVYSVEDPKCDLSDRYSKTGQVVSSETVSEEEEDSSDEGLLSMILDSQEDDEEELNVLNVVIKANTQGTLDAITKSLEPQVKDGVVHIGRAEVGAITVNDIELAVSLRAIVLGFRVPIDPVAEELANKNRILAKVYTIIYELVDEVDEASEAIQEPDEVEDVIGSGKIRKIFVLSDGSKVLGLRVESGELKHGNMCRVVRGDDVICEGKVVSMRCEKDTIQKAGTGTDCGVVLDAKEDVEEGDILECYRIVKQ